MKVLLIIAALFIFANCQYNGIGVLVPTKNGVNTTAGWVKINQQGSAGSVVTGYITGLKANAVHGLHIHTYGFINQNSLNDGTGAGGHYNPLNTNHGYPNDVNRHVGDLGNITADANGVANFTKALNNLVFLNGTTSVVGRGLILHAKNDEGSSAQPSGNAGARVMQAVIGAQKVTGNKAENLNFAKATCEVVGVTDAKLQGRVNLEVKASQIVVTGKLCGLGAASTNTLNVHIWGDLSGANRATNLGGAYNPNGSGAYTFGAVTADAKGYATVNTTVALQTASDSLLGRAIGVTVGNNVVASCVIGTVEPLPALDVCVQPTTSAPTTAAPTTGAGTTAAPTTVSSARTTIVSFVALLVAVVAFF